jgi:hypothetical protein
MRNPKQFEDCRTGYETKGVDNVHTLLMHISTTVMAWSPGARALPESGQNVPWSSGLARSSRCGCLSAVAVLDGGLIGTSNNVDLGHGGRDDHPQAIR